MGRKILTAITSIIITLFIISGAVTLTLNFRPLFYRDIDKLNIPVFSGYSEELIRKNYDILIDYNNIGGADTLELEGLAISENGRIHFEEVRNIFVAVEIITIVTAILSAGLIAANIRLRQKSFVLLSGIMSILIPAVFCILVASAWEKFFITFHLLFFDNDYWIFDPVTDPVIMILPDRFFMHCAIMIGIVILAAGAALILGYFIFNNCRKKANTETAE